MRDIVSRMHWAPGDMVIMNDPYLGGTHLPDVTLIAPLFVQEELAAFVVNRAHHADIGGETPGSMPISRSLDQEGRVIEPVHLMRGSRMDEVLLNTLTSASRNPAEFRGDIAAQTSANRWDYYETLGGGMGAGARGGGLSGVQTHMTNTLNTPIEVVESSFPVRITRYAIRRRSGGAGSRPGGDGLVREFEFTGPAQVSLLTERRSHSPWGLDGGEPGKPGCNLYRGRKLPGKVHLHLDPGDRLTIETPGGGGWGKS